MTRGESVDKTITAVKEGAASGLVEATVDIGVDNLNEISSSKGIGELTESGKTLVSDTIKASTPKVEIPKDKK